MILLASISRPGRLALSWVSVVRALSAGKLSSCREGAQISGIQTCLLAEDEGPETGPVPDAVSFCSPHSHLRRLVSEGSGNQDGYSRCSGKPSRAGRTPLLWQGRCLDVWSLKQGLSQKLCRFCSLLAHASQSVSWPAQTKSCSFYLKFLKFGCQGTLWVSHGTLQLSILMPRWNVRNNLQAYGMVLKKACLCFLFFVFCFLVFLFLFFCFLGFFFFLLLLLFRKDLSFQTAYWAPFNPSFPLLLWYWVLGPRDLKHD